eukprot:gene11467-9959_t
MDEALDGTTNLVLSNGLDKWQHAKFVHTCRDDWLLLHGTSSVQCSQQ